MTTFRNIAIEVTLIAFLVAIVLVNKKPEHVCNIVDDPIDCMLRKSIGE